MWFKKRAHIVGLLTLAISCGAPLGPAPYAWQTLATFPGGQYDIVSLAADGEAAFFALKKEGLSHTILRYLDGVITEVFVIDLKGADRAMIKDIAIAKGSGWAVGARGYSGEGPGNPFLIQYENRRWREVEIKGVAPEIVLHKVAPITPGSCWVLASEEWYPYKERFSLWKYERGDLVEYAAVKADVIVYDPDIGTTFALVLRDEIYVFISPDDGVTWFEEKIELPKPWPNYEPDRISACAAGGVLYVATSDGDGDPVASTVYRRTGTPGAGEYELLLYCPIGPNFGEVEGVAVDGLGRVLAVGKWTSAYYDGSSWVQESLPEKNHFYDVTVGATGFYAVADDENWNLQLLYHL
jgi:hypothetical protein